MGTPKGRGFRDPPTIDGRPETLRETCERIQQEWDDKINGEHFGVPKGTESAWDYKMNEAIYTIPANTNILVSDPQRHLKEHTTKRDNRFSHMARLVQQDEKFTIEGKPGTQTSWTVKELNELGLYVFATVDPKWPFVVVCMEMTDRDVKEQTAREIAPGLVDIWKKQGKAGPTNRE